MSRRHVHCKSLADAGAAIVAIIEILRFDAYALDVAGQKLSAQERLFAMAKKIADSHPKGSFTRELLEYVAEPCDKVLRQRPELRLVPTAEAQHSALRDGDSDKGS